MSSTSNGRRTSVPDVTPFSKEQQVGAGRPKKYRRKVASPKQWQALRAAKLDGRECRLLSGVPATELHHLLSRAQGGDDVAENLVGLCQDCHEAVTQRNESALRLLAYGLEDAEHAYLAMKCGEDFSERLFGVTYTGAK